LSAPLGTADTATRRVANRTRRPWCSIKTKHETHASQSVPGSASITTSLHRRCELSLPRSRNEDAAIRH